MPHREAPGSDFRITTPQGRWCHFQRSRQTQYRWLGVGRYEQRNRLRGYLGRVRKRAVKWPGAPGWQRSSIEGLKSAYQWHLGVPTVVPALSHVALSSFTTIGARPFSVASYRKGQIELPLALAESRVNSPPDHPRQRCIVLFGPRVARVVAFAVFTLYSQYRICMTVRD